MEEGQFILIGSSPSLFPRSCLSASPRLPPSVHRASKRVASSSPSNISLHLLIALRSHSPNLATTCVGRLGGHSPMMSEVGGEDKFRPKGKEVA